MVRQSTTRRKNDSGFTLTEMLIATVMVMFGLVAVAQLVPTSVMLNSYNRNDGTALVFAQRQMEAMRTQPLSAPYFTDPQGVSCYPAGQRCNLGDPTQPLQPVGCPVVLFNGIPVIDFSAPVSACVTGYYFNYTDPNDPLRATYDIRWAVITITKGSLVTGKRFIVGVFRPGMETPTLPITLDTMVEK